MTVDRHPVCLLDPRTVGTLPDSCQASRFWRVEGVKQWCELVQALGHELGEDCAGSSAHRRGRTLA